MFVIIQSLINDNHDYDNVGVYGPFATSSEAQEASFDLPDRDEWRTRYSYEILPLKDV